MVAKDSKIAGAGYNKIMQEVIKPLTRKQGRAIEFMLRDKTISKAQALREAGYAECIVRQPHKVFGSPAVITELRRRGYTKLGIWIDPKTKAIEVDEPMPAEPTPQIDFAELPLETLQKLKEMIAEKPEVSSVVEEREKYHIPTGDNVDIFSAPFAENHALSDDSFSSM